MFFFFPSFFLTNKLLVLHGVPEAYFPCFMSLPGYLASLLSFLWFLLPNAPPPPQRSVCLVWPVGAASVPRKPRDVSLNLSQLPAEVDDELQEQQTDGQEEQQAKHPER